MAIIVIFKDDELRKRVEEHFDNADVRYFFYNMFYKDMKPYVPAETESMYITAEVTESGIHFTQPYSSFPYFGKTKDGGQMHYKTDKHPLATDHWDKAAWAAKKDDLTAALQDYINRRNRNG